MTDTPQPQPYSPSARQPRQEQAGEARETGVPGGGQDRARYPDSVMTWAGRSSHCTTTATDDFRE